MSHINLIIRSLLLLALVAPSALAASVSVVPSGNSSSFSVEGVGIDGVSGIQIEIAYDPASLSTPLVTRGRLESGALFSENHSSRGVIKIAVIKNSFFSGGGQIAAISFASKTGKGGITSVTYNIINDSGSSVASSPINSKDASASEATVNTFSLTTQSAQSTQSTQRRQRKLNVHEPKSETDEFCSCFMPLQGRCKFHPQWEKVGSLKTQSRKILWTII